MSGHGEIVRCCLDRGRTAHVSSPVSVDLVDIPASRFRAALFIGRLFLALWSDKVRQRRLGHWRG